MIQIQEDQSTRINTSRAIEISIKKRYPSTRRYFMRCKFSLTFHMLDDMEAKYKNSSQ
jgi:hypothetical protein